MRPILLLAACATACSLACTASAQLLPAAGISSGAVWHLSKTIDMTVQQIVVDQDRSLSIIVSVKNNATYAFSPTPGDFLPTLTLADGEAFTSRELFRPAEPATVFRPTIAPGAEVKIRFLFKKANGMAEPKTFSIRAGANPIESLDVSTTPWTSSAS